MSEFDIYERLQALDMVASSEFAPLSLRKTALYEIIRIARLTMTTSQISEMERTYSEAQTWLDRENAKDRKKIRRKKT